MSPRPEPAPLAARGASGPSHAGPASRGAWQRPLALFALLFALLAVIAGPRLLQPAPAPHYAYMAQGWLSGRLHLEGDPPGYPRAHDDWARITTLELRDGSTLRAYPCVTPSCADARTQARREGHYGAQSWWVLGETEPRTVPRAELRRATTTWYVSFPPGPALLLLPLVALFGLAAPEVLLTAVAAAAAPAVLLAWLDRQRGRQGATGTANLVASAALGVSSPLLVLGAHGRVWFTAQVLATLGICIYIAATLDPDEGSRRRPARAAVAGLALAFAVSCRPHLLLAAPLFLWPWLRDERRLDRLAAFSIPLALVGLALAAHNYARFGSPFEFGHRFLDIRWQTRMQEIGQFSPRYLARNLRCALWLWPRLESSWPFARVSVHGMAAWIASPWLLGGALHLALRARHDRAESSARTGGLAALWLCAALVAAVPLAYHNSGQLQFSYRFALDWLPFVVAALALSGAFERRPVQVLVLAGLAIQLHGAWWFARDPASLFVLDPLGWPFESELRPPA